MVFTKSGQTKGRSGIRHLAKFIFRNLQVLTQEKVTFAKSRLAPADAFLRRKEIASGKEGIAIAFNILFLLHPKQRCPGSVRLRFGRGAVRAVTDVGPDSCSKEGFSLYFSLCPGKPRTEMGSLRVLVDRHRKYWNPKSSDAYQGWAASETIFSKIVVNLGILGGADFWGQGRKGEKSTRNLRQFPEQYPHRFS